VKNGSNGQCLADYVSNGVENPGVAACGSQSPIGGTYSYGWTFSPRSDGTFRLVSQGTGKCLTAPSFNGNPAVASCGSSGQSWRVGTDTGHGRTIRSTSNGQCLTFGYPNYVLFGACDSAQAAQLWNLA
jgi:hypothetical protein